MNYNDNVLFYALSDNAMFALKFVLYLSSSPRDKLIFLCVPLLYIKMSKTVISDLLKIFKSSVTAVLPENLVKHSMKYNPTTENLTILEDSFSIRSKNVYLIGTGKAVLHMAKEAEKILGSKLKHGIVSIPVGNLDRSYCSEKLQFYEGATNNLPDLAAATTAKKIKDLATNLGKADVLLVLISGGGSALLPLPKEPITLEEKTAVVKKLANSGADITELNTVRKKLSGVKGGRLATTAQPAQVISLILSDIVGDPLDMIASGPTTPNNDRPNQAKEVIKKYKLENDLPDSVWKVLNETECNELFPKEVKNYIIGSNELAIKAAIQEANTLKYLPIALSNTVNGNVTEIANEYAKLAQIMCNFLTGNLSKEKAMIEMDSLKIPGLCPDIFRTSDVKIGDRKGLCLILGGEITVQVKGTGKGGRNQHLALEFSKIVHDKKAEFTGYDVYLLSAGTDGIDGPTDAAGAIGYLDLLSHSVQEKLNVTIYLDNSDSYSFFLKLRNGDLHVITGHTNTNVMDIHLILIKEK